MALALWCAASWWLSSRSDPGETLGVSIHLPDWLVHGIEYAVGGFLAHRAFPRWLGIPQALLAIAFCVAWGALDEWHQSWVPGRDPAVSDLIADALGGTLGTLVSGALRRGSD